MQPEERSNVPEPSADPRPAILVVDASDFFREALRDLLADEGHRCTAAATFAEAELVLDDPDLAVVIFDLGTGAEAAIAAFERLRTARPSVRGIVLSTHADQDRVLAALRAGADDYLAKPLHEEELRLALERALSAYRTERELARLRTQASEAPAAAAPEDTELALGLVRDLCGAVTDAGDADRVSGRLMEVLGRALEAWSAALYLREPGEDDFRRAAEWEGGVGRDRARLAARGLTGAAATTGGFVAHGAPQGDARFDAEHDSPDELPPAVDGATAFSLLVLPLRFRGRTVGLVRVFGPPGSVPSLPVAEAAGAALSAALRSVLLYRSWRSSVDELARVRREGTVRTVAVPPPSPRV